MSWIPRSAAAIVIALVGALFVPSAASAGIVPLVAPAPDTTATGTSGSVQLTPTLNPGETSTPRTFGLGKPVVARMGEWRTKPGGHSGISGEPGDIVVSDDIFVENQAVLKFVVTSGDPSVELAIDVTWIEQGELEPSNYPRVNTPGTVDTFQTLPYYGLWLITVVQLSGGSGVPVDVTVTTAPIAAPLTLDPAVIDAESPTLTASWSGLDDDSGYVGLVQWDWKTATLVEVDTGGVVAEPVATTVSSALSSSIQRRGGSNAVLVAVKAADGSRAPGAVQVRVDGVFRTSVSITTGRPAIRIPLQSLPRGAHRVQVDYIPGDATTSRSTGAVLRLFAL